MLYRGLALFRSLYDRPILSTLAATTLVAALSMAWPLPEAADAPAGVVSVRLTDRHGTLLREIRPDGRGRPVSLDAVHPAVRSALIATEDRRFHRHPGVDPVAIARAAWSNLTRGEVVSGASTLTMQVARLLRGSTTRGWLDKAAEAHLALRLEMRWSKRRILQTWLNRVSFGNRAHGIEAAARLYFGKGARDLTLSESAFLVGLPQSPTRYDPFRHLDRARTRHARVLDAMVRAGDLPEADRDRLVALPLDLRTPDLAFRAPHFTEHLRTTLDLDAPPAPGSPSVAEVRTTLDARLQQAVAGLVRGRVKLLGSESVSNAAALVLDNRTGAVRAYVGSADFWNAAIGGQNDGVRMLRQPGSTLKPFTYARALESRRYTAASVLPDVELHVPEAGGAFTPTNYDDIYHGPVPLREALACSYNVPAVRLAREMGAPTLLTTLRTAGFHTLDRPPEHYGVGLTLGNGEVRLLDLARAYSALARGGSLPSVHAVRWSRTATSDTLAHDPGPARTMGIDPAVLRLVTGILADPEARAPAFGRGGPLELPFPAAAKTGTSKDYRDNWTIGFTPRHTVAVWVGNFDGAPMRRVSGVTGAGPLFQSIMMELGSGGAFDAPGEAGLESHAVCPASGHRPGPHCTAPRTEWFLPETAPTDTCDVHRVVALDRRSGLLAAAETPEHHVEHRRYTIYPEVYHPWMRENDLPLPPRVTHAAPETDAGSTWAYSDRLQVQYPIPGGRFYVDPVLRDDFQRIHLRGTAPTGWLDVHWVVNGTRLDDDYRDTDWRLDTGRHTFALRATSPDGRRLSSRPATVTVHATSAGPEWAARE